MPTLWEAEAAGNTSDVDVDQQLLGESPGGDSLPNVPLPDVPLPDAALLVALPDASEGEESTSRCVAEGEMFVVFRLGSGSCHVQSIFSNLFLWGIEYYTRRKVFGSLRVYFIYWFCVGFISFIVLWDITHAAFLQLLVCKELACEGVEAQYTSQVSWKYCELTHQAAQALHQLSSLSTVYTPLLVCHQRCQGRPFSIPPNFHAEWSSPQTACDLNIS